jgi:hypothetical protein
MVKIETHISGEVLNLRNGCPVPDGLAIDIGGSVKNPTLGRITVNGVPVRISGNKFQVSVILRDTETDIVASQELANGRFDDRIRVVWDRSSHRRYRFAIDDNIFFLREIANTNPKSLFDCPYLDGLRSLNRRYGTKFVLNMFYATHDGDFTLAKFPDKYRGEFSDNAEWLSLAFHSYSEFPVRPYQRSSRKKLADDYDIVAGEILRFAGESAYSPTTVTHWAMIHPENWGVLAERGTSILSGFFVPNTGSSYTSDGESISADIDGNGYDINYCMDDARSAYLSRHDLLKDFSSGLLFSRCDIVCNNTTVEKVEATLRPLMLNPATSEIMDIITHEQYFWPFYKDYRHDHFARCEATIRFCSDNGYAPVFFHKEFATLP